jgi:hypothetical protein
MQLRLLVAISRCNFHAQIAVKLRTVGWYLLPKILILPNGELIRPFIVILEKISRDFNT